ncbi:hypothetical protein L6164_012684 [Bauhinia variegata]|uniref:Uncharacterized protein n=1 Tax=Bauhinia variegata TaxID=167791 RepID=A0ACB9PB58_BAUVA|nr:hypothetical protein L6164_012684 [Bauhinia variegata]
MRGCKQDFPPQSCDEAHPDSNDFDFSVLDGINWPGSDIKNYTQVSEEWCRQECLRDCHCAVAFYRSHDMMCWKKELLLSYGRDQGENDVKSFVKKRKNNSTRKNDQSIFVMIGLVLLGCLVILLVPGILFAYWSRHRKCKVCRTYQFKDGMNLRNFTYEELSKATDGFKEEVGRGVSAIVYKGVLLDGNQNVIAVKRLNNMANKYEEEFKAEVTAIGRTHHRNLVQLLGFCDEGEHKLLVYEYMRNGSLAKFIFDSKRPRWYQRVQIALGTARGLLYLHEECHGKIIHCDVKPQNVLLDDSYTAKISDFGLIKPLKTDQTLTNTIKRGTKGYIAPEWSQGMPVSSMVDVYSYGVLLVELICCRRNFGNENQMALVNWAYDCFKDKKLNMLLKDDKEALDDIKRVEKYLMIAFWCIQENAASRPTMMKVFRMLDGVVDVEFPSNPNYVARQF